MASTRGKGKKSTTKKPAARAAKKSPKRKPPTKKKAPAKKKAKPMKATPRKRPAKRQAAPKPIVREVPPPASRGLTRELGRALKVMQEEAASVGFEPELETNLPPRDHMKGPNRPPWAIAGEFHFGDEMTYDDLHRVFKKWLRGGKSLRMIDPQRLGRIVVRYTDRGKPLDYVLSERMAWEACLQKSMQRTDPKDALVFDGKGSLAIRYGKNRDDGEEASSVGVVVVWLSEQVGYDVH